jgi:hypothetical protein
MKKRSFTIDLTGDDEPIDLTRDDDDIIDLTHVETKKPRSDTPHRVQPPAPSPPPAQTNDQRYAVEPRARDDDDEEKRTPGPDNGLDATPELRTWVRGQTEERRRARKIPLDEYRRRLRLEDLKFENAFVREQPQHDHGVSGKRRKHGSGAALPEAHHDPLQVAYQQRESEETEVPRFPYGHGYDAWRARKSWLTRSEASTANATATRLMREYPK